MPTLLSCPRASVAALREERGIALVTALIVMSVILFLGTFALMSSRSEIRTSANYRGRVQAQYFAESGIDLVVGYHNDLAKSPRYLFDPSKYASMNSDSSVFKDVDAIDPQKGTKVGTIHRVILGANPAAEPPPYRLRSTATLTDGSQAAYEVEVNALSLLDFAMYSEGSLTYVTPGMWQGRTYVSGDIKIIGNCLTPEVFMKRVEYTGTLTSPPGCGDFREGTVKIPPYPSLASLVNLGFYENAAKSASVCDAGVGLFIGDDGLQTVKDQSKNLFEMKDGSQPGVDDLADASKWAISEDEAVTGCTNDDPCYQVDFTLFDFAANPITYGGKTLIGWNGALLRPSTFNGVVFVDGELHVWGILGGRSVEDRATVDSVTVHDTPTPILLSLLTQPQLYRPKEKSDGKSNPQMEAIVAAAKGRPFYHHPKFTKLAAPWNTHVANRYSNNELDAGEDANANGILDPAGKGKSLTVVTETDSDIVIDHNIFYGTEPNGNRVSLGLIAGDAIYVDSNSPRGLVAAGAMIGRGSDDFGSKLSFIAMPKDNQETHRKNFWAKAAGDMNPADSTYAYDLSGNGVLETDMGQGQPGDRNETKMRDAWANLELGNLITARSASWGAWVTGLHAGTKIYDFELSSIEPPCWPVLPYYGTVSGSFTEMRN